MRETKASRVGAAAAAPRRPARGPVAHRARRGRRRRYDRVRFIGGLLLMVALTAGAFGVDGLLQASRERSRVASLQAELSSLQQRVAADEQGVASERVEVGNLAGRASGVERSVSRSLGRLNWSLQSVPSEAEMARMRGQLDADAACLGQLRSELDGLGISWRIDPAKPSTDYFKLFSSASASASCAAP
jgi:hypothetical protein